MGIRKESLLKDIRFINNKKGVGMTKKQWLTKKRQCLREFEAESAEAKHANRHIIASVKYEIKKLEREGK